MRREWNIHRGEIVKELEQLRKGGLAGVSLKGRRPSERPSGNATTSPTAVDLNPVNPGPSTSGPRCKSFPQCCNSQLINYLTDDLESLGPIEGPFWEPELVTTHIAAVHEAVGAGNQLCELYFIELPNTLSYSVLDVDRVNNSIPSALSNHSQESEDIAFDTTLTNLNPQFLDESLANLNPDSFTTLFPDSGSNFGLQEYYHDHGFSITERSEANDNGLEYIVPPTENVHCLSMEEKSKAEQMFHSSIRVV